MWHTYSRQYNICVLRALEDTGEKPLPLWLVNGKPKFLKTLASLFATGNRMLTVTKQTILKEVWTVCLDSRPVIQLEVTRAQSAQQEAEVDPAYFQRLGLRWFSHLLYSCQDQHNKKVWGGIFFPLRLIIHRLWCILTNERPSFLQGMQAKSTWSAVSSFFLHVQWGPGRSPLHEHQCDMTIYVFRKSEPECALLVWTNRFNCSFAEEQHPAGINEPPRTSQVFTKSARF